MALIVHVCIALPAGQMAPTEVGAIMKASLVYRLSSHDRKDTGFGQSTVLASYNNIASLCEKSYFRCCLQRTPKVGYHQPIRKSDTDQCNRWLFRTFLDINGHTLIGSSSSEVTELPLLLQYVDIPPFETAREAQAVSLN